MEEAPNASYQNALNEFDLMCGVKGLIMTRSNLVVTSKVRPRMGIMSCLPLGFALVSPRWLYLVLFLQFFLFVSKKKTRTKQNKKDSRSVKMTYMLALDLKENNLSLHGLDLARSL